VTRTGRGRRLLLDVALLVGVLVLLVPVAEIVVRLVAPQTLPSQEYIRSFVLEGMYVADDAAGYRLAPGFSGRLERAGHETEFSTNSLGLRGDELGPKDRPRVLALGDSFTWGWGVPQGEEWIHWAGEAAEKAGAPPLQTINGGVNGYGTESALELFREIGRDVQPDVVLLGFFANDYTDNLLGATGIYTVRDGYLFDHFSHDWFQESFLARESHLYRLVSTAWETFRVKYLGGVPSNRPAHNFSQEEFRRGMELSARWIEELDGECAAVGAKLAVVWLPADVYALSRRRPEDIPLRHELQRKVAAAGIPSIDLLPVVTAEQRLPGLYLANDGHFSVRGNRVAGRAVGRWLVEEGLLPAE
jgi:lysophospholipase L1-like esterase